MSCSFCDMTYLKDVTWRHEREQHTEIVAGCWTNLFRGVDERGRMFIFASGEDDSDRYYPKFCPECGAKCESKEEIKQRSIGEIYEAIHSVLARSAWEKGVIRYADELLNAYLGNRGLSLDDIHVHIGKITEADLLRGAPSWEQYSRGGMALVCNEDICRRLCTKVEFRKKAGGQVQPVRGGDWLDHQTKALEKAAEIVLGAANWVKKTDEVVPK